MLSFTAFIVWTMCVLITLNVNAKTFWISKMEKKRYPMYLMKGKPVNSCFASVAPSLSFWI